MARCAGQSAARHITQALWPESSRAAAAPSRRSHRRSVKSSLALRARREGQSTATAMTQLRWPPRRRKHSPLLRSHKRKSRSLLPLSAQRPRVRTRVTETGPEPATSAPAPASRATSARGRSSTSTLAPRTSSCSTAGTPVRAAMRSFATDTESLGCRWTAASVRPPTVLASTVIVPGGAEGLDLDVGPGAVGAGGVSRRRRLSSFT
mmetsp:Transcript_81163/g.251891  ORF Transcript_81163/g.251891 Transcript_81163/m.251891 type:complete len:207 (-) Transcript_81163:82-702(-)